MQGVFFRESTRREAIRIGLFGWVRNLPDGRVEAVFEGSEGGCAEALAYVRVGPSSARVDDVEVVADEPEQGLDDFAVRF